MATLEELDAKLRNLEARLHAGEFLTQHAPQHGLLGQDPLPASSLTVKEVDGTPSVSGVTIIEVSNGTLTDNGSGDVTVVTGAGGAGGHTIRENGTNQTARTGLNFVDAAAGAGLVVDDAGGDETEVHLDLYTLLAATPGGELGGTYASPTVDATHSGSTHSAATDTHIADAVDAHDASAISILDTAGDFTATDVEGALAEIQSDNEAHVAAADPHTGYRLESADHTHASSGIQGGTIAHGVVTTSGLKKSRWFGAQAFRSALTNGPSYALVESTTNKVMYPVLDFDDTTSESAQAIFFLPDNYNAAVSMTAKVIWTTASGTGTVIWNIAAMALTDDDAIDTAGFASPGTVTDTRLADNDVHISGATSAIDPSTSDGTGRPVWIKVSRDISDTKAGDARLIGMILTYEVTALSS